MRNITVEPEQLALTAARMEEENDNYIACYHDLFHTVEMMAASWQGKDNIAFTSRISGFEDDCRQLSVLCTQYSDFLRYCGRAYEDMQNELASVAGRLMN